MVKAYICGHLCRDIAHEKLCPDIGAPDVGRKDCPIHNPRTNSFPRRRSSLSKPPMLARDESTFEDVMEEETIENAKSADQSDAGNKVDLPQRKKKAAEEWQTPFLDRPVYHVSRDARGDADWRKHVRVEKAMKQILFGDARVSADVVLEHTQKVGMSERNLLRGRQASGNAEANIGEDLDYVDLRDAMAAAKAEAEKHTVKWAEQATAEPKAGPAAETEPSKHLPDCAVYSDEEIDAEDEFHDTLASRSISKTHRCMSEDECSSCAGGVNFPDDPRGSTPDILAEDDLLPWVGRSRTS